MTRKFLLADVKEYLKLQYKFYHTFVLQRLVDEIFQFEFFVLPANYVTFCIMRHQKVNYKVFSPEEIRCNINGMLVFVLNLHIVSILQEFCSLKT